MKEAEMEQIADLIKRVINRPQDKASIQEVRKEVLQLTEHFPIP
jgi:glycine/serine hydroxymethyltransferase